MYKRISDLEEKIQLLRKSAGIHDDKREIKHLHHIYGYYFDVCLFDELVDLFADDGEVRFMGGIFKGKSGVRRLFCGRLRERHTNGHNGPVFGLLLEHIMLQDVITVEKDRKTAKARFRCFMQAGRHHSAEGETKQWWEGGLYENEYVKEEGRWKIKVLDYRGLWHADFRKGWAYTPPNLYPFYSTTYPEDPIGPDEIITVNKPVLWPDTNVFPFHYEHPVTGKSEND